MLQKRKSTRIVKIIFLLFLCFFLLAELVLRIAFYEPLKSRAYPLIYKPDSLLGYTYIPNAASKICIPSISKSFTINTNGFYGPSFSTKKQKALRIAIVGNSQASGIWLTGKESFAMIMQELVNKKEMDVEILNFSIDGVYRDIYNLNLITTEVIKYSPDLVFLNADIPFVQASFQRDIYKDYVIIYNGKNPQSKEWCKAKVDYVSEYPVLAGLYKGSFVVRAFCNYYSKHSKSKSAFNLRVFVEKKVQAPDIIFLPYSITKTIDLIANARKKLQASGGRLILFDYDPNPKKKGILDKYGVTNMSLNIPDDKSLVYEYDGHDNEKAHALIAQQFVDSLISQKYIPVKL